MPEALKPVTAAFETSTRPGSVALWTGFEMLELELADSRRHACDLLPSLEQLLTRASLGVSALQVIAMGIGPGSYTGLRVGVATALGLSLGTRAALRAVPSFEALAFGLLAPGEEISIAMDARSNGWYFARFRRREHDVETLVEPAVLAPSELLKRLEPNSPTQVDDAAARLLDEAGIDWVDRRQITAPRAADVARLGMRSFATHGPHTASDCEPLYLRPFAVKQRRRS